MLRYNDAKENVLAHAKSVREAAVLLASSVTVAYLTGNLFPEAPTKDKPNPDYMPVEKVTAEMQDLIKSAGKTDRTISVYITVGHKLFVVMKARQDSDEYKPILDKVRNAKSVADASQVIADLWASWNITTLDGMKEKVGLATGRDPNRAPTTTQERVTNAIVNANKRADAGKADAREITVAVAENVPDPVLAVETLLARIGDMKALDAIIKEAEKRKTALAKIAKAAEKEAHSKAKEGANENAPQGERQTGHGRRHGAAAA